MKSKRLLLTLLLALLVPWAAMAQETVTIGEGTATSNTNPIGTYYNYSITEQLYTAEEIGMAGTISSISFYYMGTAAKDLPITVYMKQVDEENLVLAGISLADADEVFSGTLSVTTTAGWVTIELDTPFAYDGTSNLLIGCIKDYLYYFNGQTWQGTATTSYMARYTQSDSDGPYTTSTVPSNTQEARPNIQMVITAGSGPSCAKPNGLAVAASGTDATFTWNGEADEFDVAHSMDASADPNNCIVGQASTTLYQFTNLELGDHYVWVRANCGSNGYSDWSAKKSFHIGYCVPAPSSVDNNGISNVTFGTGDYVVNNDTPKATYADYSTQIGAVQAGVESTIAITFKTGYTYNTYVWVDLDNSLSFEADEVVCYGESTNSNPTTLTLNFTIPATQTLGDFGLRIGSADSGLGSDPTAANPCYTGSYGCFQDYTLRVLEAPSCLPPTGLAASDVTAHEATISWTSDASAWEIQLDEEEAIEVTEATYSFTGLTAETEYSVKVRTNCSGTYSDWTNAISFTTTIACPAPTGLAFTLTPGDGTVATFSWTENGSATAWQLCINGDEDNLIDMDENPFTYNGFTPEETYTAKVRAVCGGIDGESQWSSTVTFTPTNAYTLTVNDGTTTNGYVPVYGTWVDSYTKCQFIIPASELEAMQWGTISKMTFYSSTQNKTWGAAEFDILLTEVDNSTFESATLVDWSSMEQVYHGAVSISDYKMEIVFDNDYQYMGGNLLVGFHQTVKGTYGGISWYGVSSTNSAIGGYESSAKALSLQSFLPKTTFDFVPGEAPACPKPTGLAVNYAGGITATVTWEGTATSYNIDVNGTVTEGVTSPYTLEGLELATTYAVMVQANCGNNGTSEWTSAVSFTTDLCLPENMCEIGIEMTDAYSDGGGQIQVVDALTGEVLGTYTNSGASTSYTLAVCDGRELNFVFASTDNWPYENGYVITDVAGEIIAEHVGCTDSNNCEAPTNGVVATYTVDCFPCAKPTNLAAEIQNYTSANLTWDGTNDSYNLRYREAYFYDDFENGFAKWNVIDADGDGYGFVLGSESGGIYLVETGSLAGTGHNGSNDLVVSASYSNVTGALSPDNYMVSPKLELGQTFSFWACAQDASYPEEHFGVAVSTESNNNPDDFTTIAEWTLTAKGTSAKANPGTTRSGNRGQGKWYQYTVDLSAYAGQEGYIAIRHFDCSDQFILNLDDVTYGPAADEGWTVVEGLASKVYLLENLNEHTNYEFQLQGVCGTDDQSDWTSSAYFSTLADEPQAVLDGGAWNNPDTWVNSGNQVPEPNQNVTVLGDVMITENLEFNGEITIADGASLTVETGVVFNAGEINVSSPDQLVIESGAEFMHTGEVPATVNLTYLASNAKDGEYGLYRLIASPINPYVTVNATGLVPASTDANYPYVDLYSFDQSSQVGTWINYKQADNHFVTLDIKKGYLYSNRNNASAALSGLTLSTSIEPYVDLDYTDGMMFAGWNLVGNPFTCSCYITDGTAAMPYYVLALNADGKQEVSATQMTTALAPMAGAFVQATAAGQKAYFTTTQPSRGASLDITVNQGRGMVDNAFINFGGVNTLEKFQLNPNHTKIYFPQEGKDYAVVTADNQGEMPVNFKAENDGTYTFNFSNTNVEFGYLRLIDNLTGVETNLLETPYYTFNAKASDYASRFRLVFITGSADEDSFAFFNNGNFIINNEGDAILQVIDVNGRILKSENINGCVSLNVNAAPGVYMIRLINGENVRIQKVVVR